MLKNLIEEVERNYKRVPYHNFTHAFNIVHMSYYILKMTKAREYLEDLDILAVMIGAMGHDIDHSGMNNVYYQKTKHPMALAVNDSSVLENYHGYMLFKILAKESYNVLSGLSTAEFGRFRKATIEVIMGTDMTRHFSITSSF